MGTKVYDNSNSGALFKNNDKQSDKSPDYKGELNVNGESFGLSGWAKTSRKGVRFLSLSVKPKREKIDRSKPLREDIQDEVPW